MLFKQLLFIYNHLLEFIAFYWTNNRCFRRKPNSHVNASEPGLHPEFGSNMCIVYKSPPPLAILNIVARLQLEMEGFSVFQSWVQNLMFSFIIWNHRWLLTFLSIALLQCTVRLKCRYFRNNWNSWRKYKMSKHRKSNLLIQSLTFPNIRYINIFSWYVLSKFLPHPVVTSDHKWQ